MEQEVLWEMSRPQSFLAKSTRPNIASETFPVGPAIDLDNFSPATKEKKLEFRFEYHTYSCYQAWEQAGASLQVAKGATRCEEKTKAIPHRCEGGDLLLHTEPCGAPNTATSTDAHSILCNNGADCGRNANADVFRVSAWMHLYARNENRLFSNAVLGERRGSRERKLWFEVSDAGHSSPPPRPPEAVQRSLARYPWVTWILKHPAIRHYNPTPNFQVKHRTHTVLFL